MSDEAAFRPGWDEVVIIASGTSWDGVPLSEKHLARHLAERVPVLFVDPPVSPLSRLRNPAAAAASGEPPLRLVAPNIARLTPRTVPGVSRPVLRDVAAWATRRAIRRTAHALGARVRALVVGSLDDVLHACDADLRVLYGTDDWAAGGELMALSDRWLVRRERDQLEKADHVIAVSETLARKWEPRARAVSVIPNGCDAELFERSDITPPATDVDLPGPIAGFIGHLSDRIDLEMLERVAETGHSLLLVGPRQSTFAIERTERLFARENVRWLGPRPFEALPSYMRLITVGLTPYANSPFNRSSFPLKTLEYLAAGRPAVVTDLPSSHMLPRDLVTICADAGSFAAATVRQLEAPGDEALGLRRRAYAQQHSWAARAAQIAELIGVG
ncbi:MAG: glycosyltransferase [Georgenia sp.]